MMNLSGIRFTLIFFVFLLFPWSISLGAGKQTERHEDLRVPILLYHRFGPTVADSMTVTTKVFESHLKYLKDNGYKVIPLAQLVDYYLRKGPPPPPKSAVIVVDDGHKTVFTEILPIIKKYNVPVTLFIYPSAISNASYAMTWAELIEIKRSNLADFQSHSYWHPNFKKEKKRSGRAEYEKFVDMQLRKSKEKIEKELGNKVNMLAWPFGIYDDELINKARGAGYIAGFSIERRHSSPSDNIMALPRYLLVNTNSGKDFERMLKGD